MNYKATCPTCGTKVSRWRLFSTPVIYYRCGNCGASFRVSPAGWIASLIVVAAQLSWFVLYRFGIIASYVGIGLLLLTCGLAIWLLPYFSPVRLRLHRVL
jgi:DNA-directed RNA polymerase subunit RPC12/RpoP